MHPCVRGGRRPCRPALLLTLFAAAPVYGQRVQLPEPVGYVNDFADVIPEGAEASIRNVIDEVRAKSGGEIVVVTLRTLPEGRSRDEIALEIGRQWRIGAAGEAGDVRRNTGAIVLVVPKETSEDGQGHLKLELGDRTSTFVTATEAGRIRDGLMVPAFRERDYGGGILAGVVALAQLYADEFGFELTGDYPRPEPRGAPSGRPSMVTIVLVILVVFWLSRGFRGGRGGGSGFGGGGRRRRRAPVIVPIPFPMGGRRGGFGGFGGGFGGFGGGRGGFGGFGGGGGFSGGGAGGSW